MYIMSKGSKTVEKEQSNVKRAAGSQYLIQQCSEYWVRRKLSGNEETLICIKKAISYLTVQRANKPGQKHMGKKGFLGPAREPRGAKPSVWWIQLRRGIYI